MARVDIVKANKIVKIYFGNGNVEAVTAFPEKDPKWKGWTFVQISGLDQDVYINDKTYEIKGHSFTKGDKADINKAKLTKPDKPVRKLKALEGDGLMTWANKFGIQPIIKSEMKTMNFDKSFSQFSRDTKAALDELAKDAIKDIYNGMNPNAATTDEDSAQPED